MQVVADIYTEQVITLLSHIEHGINFLVGLSVLIVALVVAKYLIWDMFLKYV